MVKGKRFARRSITKTKMSEMKHYRTFFLSQRFFLLTIRVREKKPESAKIIIIIICFLVVVTLFHSIKYHRNAELFTKGVTTDTNDLHACACIYAGPLLFLSFVKTGLTANNSISSDVLTDHFPAARKERLPIYWDTLISSLPYLS